MERRNWSASPGVKPAATTAICMTCSWKIGTPMVREYVAHLFAGIGFVFLALAPAQVGMHHAALDRPGPHDGHLHHQVVVLARPQPGQHAHLRARLDLEHADGVGVADHVVGRIVARRNVLQPQRRRDAGRPAPACGAAPTACPAPARRPSAASASRSSLSHCTTLRSGMAAFSIGTRRESLPREITKPPGCCDRWRGKPISVCASQAIAAPRASPGPARRRPACAAFPSCHPTTGARAPPRRSRRCPRPARGRCRAARCAADRDDHRGQRARSRPYLS